MNKQFRIGNSRTLVELVSEQYITISSGSIVMLRLEGAFGYVNTWWEIIRLSCEDKNLFSGQLIRKHHEYNTYEIGDHNKWHKDLIQDVLKIGDNFCYSDNVTICNCKGLCRNNY